jgi:hypothetical protein
MKSPPPLLKYTYVTAAILGWGGGGVGPLCRFTVMGYIVYRFQLAGKKTAIIVIAAISSILYFCRTDQMPHTLAFIQTYTMHVHTVGGGKEYTLRGTHCTYILLVVERNTPCIKTLGPDS